MGSLTGVSTDVCERTEIHRMTIENDIMHMRKVDSVAPASGSAIHLSANEYHIMLLGLKRPLKMGDHFTMTLTYRDKTTSQAKVRVIARGDKVPE